MTIFIITETYGFDDSTVVAVCDSHASAIQWLINNKGLNENYTEYHFHHSEYMSLKELYGENWLKTLLECKSTFFQFDNANYEIEEKELFSEKPLDI